MCLDEAILCVDAQSNNVNIPFCSYYEWIDLSINSKSLLARTLSNIDKILFYSIQLNNQAFISKIDSKQKGVFHAIGNAQIHILLHIRIVCANVQDGITKTCLYNFDPLKPHFYIGKLGFTGVYIIFSYFCSKT